MSFFCRDDCRTRRGIERGVCISCPTAEYYRDLYVIDERGRPFIRTINIPEPINLPNIDFTASGFFISTFTTSVAVEGVIPFNAALNQNFINSELPFIQIARAGTYQIDYIINSTSGGTVALMVGSGIAAGTTTFGNDTIVGSAVINIGFVPANLSVVNVGLAPIDIVQAQPGGVSAQLTVTQVR